MGKEALILTLDVVAVFLQYEESAERAAPASCTTILPFDYY